MAASRSELTRVTATRSYESLSIFAIVLVLALCTWSCWISHCERAALNRFDKAIGVEHVEGR
jgi:ABC-type nickel/cobalt efflux system permease component RcnA